MTLTLTNSVSRQAGFFFSIILPLKSISIRKQFNRKKKNYLFMSYAITINSSALRFVKRHEHALSNLKSTALITEFPCDWNSSYGLPLNGANWKWKLSFGCFSEYLVASWFIICFPCLIHTVAVYSEGRREKKFNFRFPVGRHTTMEWMSCATVDFSCFDIRNNSSNEKKKRKKKPSTKLSNRKSFWLP